MNKNKYRIYIDEVGTEYLPKNKQGLSFGDRYLCLIGIILQKDSAVELLKKFYELRGITTDDVDEYSSIHIHRKNIVEKSLHFSILKNKNIENLFNIKLLSIIKETKFEIIYTVIDKLDYLDNQSSLYNIAFQNIVDTYNKILIKLNGKGDLMIECRGKKEDRSLQEFFENNFRFENITSKTIKFKTKAENIAGIELADLLAVPMLFKFLDDVGHRTFDRNSFNYKIIEIITNKNTTHIE